MFKFIKNRIVPFVLITFIFTFVLYHDYNQAYATNLPGVIPDSGAWSYYDILYTLFNSIGITLQLDPQEGEAPGALPSPWASDEEYVAYLDSIPYFDVPSEEIHKVNQWTLKHSLNSDISLWKVRAAISGKGAAPRMRLSTRNQFNYQLLGINWVYREQNMR